MKFYKVYGGSFSHQIQDPFNSYKLLLKLKMYIADVERDKKTKHNRKLLETNPWLCEA